MEKKLNLPKYWFWFSVAFMAVCFIVLIHLLKLSEWILIPVFLGYLVLNALIFNSYYLGMVGTYYIYRGKEEKAYKVLKKAIDKGTRNVNALFFWGLRLLKEGKAEEALKHLTRAHKFNTKILLDKEIMLAMGSCYWIINDIEQGIKTLEELKKKYQYINPETLTTLGYFYFLKDDFEKAVEYTNAALEDNPELASAWDNLGQIYYKKNDIEKAKEYFLKAIEYKNTMPDSLYYMGEIYEQEGNIEKAREYYTRASESKITALNTITLEQVKQKLDKLVFGKDLQQKEGVDLWN